MSNCRSFDAERAARRRPNDNLPGPNCQARPLITCGHVHDRFRRDWNAVRISPDLEAISGNQNPLQSITVFARDFRSYLVRPVEVLCLNGATPLLKMMEAWR